MDRTKEHVKLLKELLVELGKCPELGRFWQNETGTALSVDGKRMIKYGLVGSADILGFSSQGIFCAFEVKTGRADQTRQQRAFQKTLTDHHGIYIVIRDLEQGLLTIKKALREQDLFLTKDSIDEPVS